MIHHDAFSDATAAHPKVSSLRRGIVMSALDALDDAGYIVAPRQQAVVTRDAGERNDLPAPRLQLRWEHEEGDTWLCHYEMIIPLGELDIRRDRDEGEKKSRFMALPMGNTRIFPIKLPLERGDNGMEVRTPLRDGMHASWDSHRLGMPAFVMWEEHIKPISPSLPNSEKDNLEDTNSLTG